MDDIDISNLDFEYLPYDREKLVEWIEENKDTVENSRELWVDLKTNVISLVETPAHPSKIVEKSDEAKADTYKLVQKSESLTEKRVIYAPAMVSNRPDREGDVVPDFVVQDAAHKYLAQKRTDEVDMAHETLTGSDNSFTHRGTVVESWILGDDQELKTADGNSTVEYKEGDWMVGIHVGDDEAWEKIESGEIKGLSVMGEPYPAETERSDDGGLILSNAVEKDMSEQSTEEIKMDVEEVRSELEQYNIDTDDMNDEDVIEFAEALHNDLMEQLQESESSEEEEKVCEHCGEEDCDGECQEEKENMSDVATMIADTISDMSEEDAMILLERMDNDSDTVDQDSYEDKSVEKEIQSISERLTEIEEKIDSVTEEQTEKDEDPCWENYEMVGLDENGDPICVPNEDAQQARSMIEEEFETNPEEAEKEETSDEDKDVDRQATEKGFDEEEEYETDDLFTGLTDY